LELADIVSSIRRRWRIVAGVILLTVAVIAAFYVTRKEVEPTPRYRSDVRVLVPTRDTDANGNPTKDTQSDVPESLYFGQAAIAQSSELHTKALDDAHVPQERRAGVTFGYNAAQTGGLVTFSVYAHDEGTAGAVARSWADAYVQSRGQQVAKGSTSSMASQRRGLTVLTNRLSDVENQLRAIDPALLTLTAQTTSANDPNASTNLQVPTSVPLDTALLVYERDALQRSIEQGRENYAEASIRTIVPRNFADIVEIPPVANITPAASSPSSPTLLIAGVGLLLALGLPILIDRLDRTIRDSKTATAAFSAPVLCVIPAVPRSRRDEIAAAGSPREAAFRALATTAVATDKLPRSIVVTSPIGSMQDAVAANFASALASLGLRVALIGTSPRQRWYSYDGVAVGPHRNGDTPTFPRLLELAYDGRLNGEVPGFLLRARQENLLVLPPGETDVNVSPDGLPPLLHALTNADVDVTVIAAPALLEDPNTTIYAWTTRSVLWVSESGETTIDNARAGASRLALAGVTPFGVAVVDEES
jgi:capsular polysaccharide biosynthesis protein